MNKSRGFPVAKRLLIENFTEEVRERGALIGLLRFKWTESEIRLRAATKTIARLRSQLKQLRAEARQLRADQKRMRIAAKLQTPRLLFGPTGARRRQSTRRGARITL